MDFSELQNPGSQWRAKPFWALNDELEVEEIRAQIRSFADMGFGGYFMHSRVGLKTKFLGVKWFEMIAAGIDEGKKLGLETWLYDEDRWPSGIAGGYVTMDHRFRMKRLHCIRTKGDSIPIDAIAVHKAEIVEGHLHSYHIASDFGRDEDVLAFVVRTGYPSEESMGFYNGFTYLDTLSKQAVGRFIEVAYEPYLQFRDEFGNGIKGMFTDEPNRSSFLGTTAGGEWEREGNQYQIPWTSGFEDEFEQRMGYSLLDKLPEVFFNVAGHKISKTRYDVSEVTAQLFVEAFPKQISHWCEKNGIALTGHFLGEDNLESLAWSTGMVDRFYESMQIPGIDLIRKTVNFMIPKQVQGAARQFNKPWTMSEMYASSGWGYSLQEYKAYGDWNAVFGINLRCPHLSLYSMAGQRKRDCPPSISYQQAWYREYKVVEDHFARVGAALSEGAALCHVLLVHPVDSIAGVLLPGWMLVKEETGRNVINACDSAFRKLAHTLMAMQIDFDISEEAIIEKHAKIETVGGSSCLVIGKMIYQCVAVTKMVSMRKGVAELLEAFSKAGGRVVFVGAITELINFEPAVWYVGFHKIDNEPESIRSAFSPYATLEISGYESSRLLATHKRGVEFDVAFIINTSLSQSFTGDIRIQREGQAQIYDTLTCERHEISASCCNGWTAFDLELPKGGSVLLFITDKREELPVLPQGILRATRDYDADWLDIRLDSPNILLLDRPHYHIEGGSEGCEHILELDNRARDFMGFMRRSNSMYQPWFRREFFKGGNKCCMIELIYKFLVRTVPKGELFLCLEQPERHTITLNEVPVGESIVGWFTDKAIKKLRIDNALIKPGINKIVSVCVFSEETDLEAMYLLGDFGVNLDEFNTTIIEPVRRLMIGDISSQGLPFYAGSVFYSISCGKITGSARICTSRFNGIALKLHQAGSPPLLMPFEPYETSIHKEQVEIELICSMGNAFGIEAHNVNGYPLEAQGLMGYPQIKWEKRSIPKA